MSPTASVRTTLESPIGFQSSDVSRHERKGNHCPIAFLSARLHVIVRQFCAAESVTITTRVHESLPIARREIKLAQEETKVWKRRDAETAETRMKATRFFSAISASLRFQIDRAPFRVSGFVAASNADCFATRLANNRYSQRELG